MLTIEALNYLYIKLFGIGNAYLNVEIYEKVYSKEGREFGPELAGKITVIVWDLYGLRYTGNSFYNHLAVIIRDLGLKASLTDTYTCTKPAIKSRGYKYYGCVNTLVDDGMTISDNPSSIIKVLEAT